MISWLSWSQTPRTSRKFTPSAPLPAVQIHTAKLANFIEISFRARTFPSFLFNGFNKFIILIWTHFIFFEQWRKDIEFTKHHQHSHKRIKRTDFTCLYFLKLGNFL